jgi:hypothetical protein
MTANNTAHLRRKYTRHVTALSALLEQLREAEEDARQSGVPQTIEIGGYTLNVLEQLAVTEIGMLKYMLEQMDRAERQALITAESTLKLSE